MGNIHKRGNVYYADYVDRDGQRHQPSLRTRDREVARAKLRELELATTDSAAHQTEILNAALSYFVDVSCAARPAGTIRCYRQKAGHLSRLLGVVPLDAFTRETVERYIATRLTEGAAKHTVHKDLVVLRGALRSAQERDRYHGAIDVVPKFNAEYEPRRTYLTPEQFIRLTDNILRPLGGGASEYKRARWEARRVRRTLHVLLSALAGPRLGELEAMTWEHVDLHRDVLVIPKGKTVSRLIAIHPVLRLWLERYYEPGDGPVVEKWTKVSRDLPRLCEACGIPRATMNDLRRSFASWLVQGGETLYVVSRLLGHKSTRMVELVYGQLDQRTLDGAIGRLPGGSHAGVTRDAQTRGAGGARGTADANGTPTVSLGDSSTSAENLVPRDGVEPPTRGFSVPLPDAPKPVRSKPVLKLVG